MKIEFVWEKISSTRAESGCDVTIRSKVMGGWLVRSIADKALCVSKTGDISIANSQSMVFVPDPNHEWEIEVIE
jgi:hypothetical protein